MVKPEDVPEIVEEHLLKGTYRSAACSTRRRSSTNSTIKVPERDHVLRKAAPRVALRNCGVINPENIDEYIARRRLSGARQGSHGDDPPQQVIQTMLDSGLRGRGGAGFPTGLKWNFAAANQADQKYVCCNADEGDPGAFMDRSILEGDPHSVHGSHGHRRLRHRRNPGLYLRPCRVPHRGSASCRLPSTRPENTACSAKISSIPALILTLRLRLGAGAFVCGEETALMTSIEGKRGEPRPRPPFPALKGLFRKPTILNNVETYANIPQIILKGAGVVRAPWVQRRSKGTKVFALGGKINNTGLVEVPMGTTLREDRRGDRRRHPGRQEVQGGPDRRPFRRLYPGRPSWICPSITTT